jgi:hypothetical protein
MNMTGPYVKVIADSVGPTGSRITTLEARYHRFIHSELLTHRVFSRNSASSRAIPVEKMIQRVIDDPAVPLVWGKNQAGMQAREEVSPEVAEKCREEWIRGRDAAVTVARNLASRGLHKQLVNRVLEPYSHITTIITGTEWENFFDQRCHDDAQPEMMWLAVEMRRARALSTPERLRAGEWHLPYIADDDRQQAAVDDLPFICAARCARVSYLTHDGRRDLGVDLALAEKLKSAPHWSPFEHPAAASSIDGWQRNFRGWGPLRAELEIMYSAA